MSWICKNCETENSDKLDICEVCESCAPTIFDFIYDKVLTGNPIGISWKTANCNNVSIIYNGETTDVSEKNTYSIEDPSDSTIKFLLANSCVTERAVCFEMKFVEKPSIDFTTNRTKLRKGKSESTELSWNIKNAESAVLKYDDKVIDIPKKGIKKFTPHETTNYRIEALAKDKATIFTESLLIGVYSECKIDFIADKQYIYPSIPVKLSWNVENANKVWLDSVPVEATGTKIIEPKKPVTCILSAEDEFGVKEKRFDIRMLPVPQVKSLLVPTPNITNNLAIHISQPRYTVSVKIPTINIGMVKVEIPQVPSLTDLGYDVKLSLPKTSRLGKLEKAYNFVKNIINNKL